jgi:hypothetical protein
MPNRFLKILIFVSIVVLFDKLVGATCEQLYYRSNDNNIYRLCYTLNAAREDILIFGSSRAQHHFIPRIINKNTGLSSYNCGFGGEGLLFSLIQLNEALKRYKPKLIVLEVSPNILIDPESHQKLKLLLPFSNRDPLIFDALTSGEFFERVKLLSAIYPYNSTIASLITGGFKKNIDTLKGFLPLDGKIDTLGLTDKINSQISTSVIPTERLNALKEFITLCTNHNIKIAVVVSPVYQTNGNLDKMTEQVEKTCVDFKNVHFLNYSTSNIYHWPDYFKDNLHLNAEGARIFSEDISLKLKEVLDK